MSIKYCIACGEAMESSFITIYCVNKRCQRYLLVQTGGFDIKPAKKDLFKFIIRDKKERKK